MLEPILHLLIAYWISDMFSRSQILKRFLQRYSQLDRMWVHQGGIFFVVAMAITMVFPGWNIRLFLAILIISVCFYVMNRWLVARLVHRMELMTYIGIQSLHIVAIYVGLLLFGQAFGLSQLLKQLHVLLFAEQLVVDKVLYVPTILLTVLFLVSITPEIIDRFLARFGRSADAASQHETAAGIEVERSTEVLWSRRDNLIRRIDTDAIIEEQFEITNDENSQAPRSKESLKVQYHWYRKEEDMSKGRYIGILERLIVCLFVFYGVYHGLVLLGAMKTLARFKMFESKAFAEYYLIGTLLSLLLACLCGFLLRRII